MDRRDHEHTQQILKACVGLLQDTDETAVHVTSTRQETQSDQTEIPPKSHDEGEDEPVRVGSQNNPSFSAEVSETPKSVNVNITINIVATNSPVTIGSSFGNRNTFAGKVLDIDLMLECNEELKALEDAAKEYFQNRQIQLQTLHRFVYWLNIFGYVPIDALIWKTLLVSLIALAIYFSVAPGAAVICLPFFGRAWGDFIELKAIERRLSENLKTTVERVNSVWVSLGKMGEITLPVVFGEDRIFDSEGPINTLAWKVLKFNGGIGSLAREFEETAKKLNCPSTKDVKVCISRVRYKLMAL